VHTIEESERQSHIIWGTDNIFKTYLVEKGEVDSVWADAAFIVEGNILTGAAGATVHRNNESLRRSNRSTESRVGIVQCPYYVHKALMALLQSSRGQSSRRTNGNPAGPLEEKRNIRR